AVAEAVVPVRARADAAGRRLGAGDGAAAAGAAADGADRHHPADPDLGEREVGEGGAELHERADVRADRADHRTVGEPGQEPAVAVHRTVPGAEPDDPQAGARGGDQHPGMGRVPRRRFRPRPRPVAGRRPPLPPRAPGDLGLRRAAPSPARGGRSKKEARRSAGLLRSAPAGGGAYCEGLKLMVRRVVTGAGTGTKRQRRTALSASRSKVRAGLAWTTRAELTEPSNPTVNSTWTSPEVPARSACGG